jgi:DNA mismatch repair protein MutS
MPAAVIEAAKARLKLLENRAASESQRGSSPQLRLPLEQTNARPVLAVLERVESDEVSPKEALELLYRLTELCETGR